MSIYVVAEARRMAGVTLVQREHSVGELWVGASPAMRLRVARVPGVAGRPGYWFAVCRVASGTRAGETVAEARGATWQACGEALEAAWRARVRSERETALERVLREYVEGGAS
jgi:hypothetical protein